MTRIGFGGERVLEIIGKGIVAGAVYGLWKYYNKKQKAIDERREHKMYFKKRKFVKTLLVGAVVGGIAAYSGVSVEMAFGNELLYFGAVVVVEEALKTVWRFLQRHGM